MKLTHWQFVQSNKPPQPCDRVHQTFGGRCLNCGHDPNRDYKITFQVVK